MEPITRKELILSGEDIKPITRLEYFLKKAVEGGGGGGLPTYTSADKGKFLGLGEGSSSTTEVIVPEQEVTLAWYTMGDESVLAALLSNVSVENFEQADYSIKVNGTDYELTGGDSNYLEFGDYRVEFNLPDTPTGLFFQGNNGSVGSTYTISLTRSVPSVEPKWEQVGGALVMKAVSAEKGQNNDWTFLLDTSYADYLAAWQNGTPVYMWFPAPTYDDPYFSYTFDGVIEGNQYMMLVKVPTGYTEQDVYGSEFSVGVYNGEIYASITYPSAGD